MKEEQLKAWLEGKLSEEELRQLKQGEGEIEEIDSIIKASGKLRAPKGKSKQEAWEGLMEKVAETPEKKVKSVKALWGWSAGIAASFLLLATIASYFYLTVNFETGRGEKTAHVLPDASKVQMNAGSKLSYFSPPWSDQRTVTLEGEAFFEVESGNSFVVNTAEGSVKVLGTSFNVFQRNGYFKVHCHEGKVEVNAANSQVILQAGEFVELGDKERLEKQTFELGEAKSWLTGEFYFQNIDFQEVIEELERQFDKTIELSATSTQRYTGYFNANDLEEALQLTLGAMGFSYTIEKEKIIVK